MSHSVKGFGRLRERFVLWMLSLVERCMFSVLPHGRLRRRMRDRIDSALRLDSEQLTTVLTCRKEAAPSERVL